MKRPKLPPPLTPPDCDLHGVPAMMLDLNIMTSDLAALSTGEEFKAAILLYGASYAQIPAGSLPTDDRLLAFLSRAGIQQWPNVKQMALRGWIECSDRRLYHPVTAEKVLYAWIGRLKQRLASGAGNESRWNIAFDRAAVEGQIATAMAHLQRIAPDSPELIKWLKKNPGGTPGGTPGGNADGTPETIPPGSPRGSQVEAEVEAQKVEKSPSQEEGIGLRVVGGGA